MHGRSSHEYHGHYENSQLVRRRAKLHIFHYTITITIRLLLLTESKTKLVLHNTVSLKRRNEMIYDEVVALFFFFFFSSKNLHATYRTKYCLRLLVLLQVDKNPGWTSEDGTDNDRNVSALLGSRDANLRWSANVASHRRVPNLHCSGSENRRALLKGRIHHEVVLVQRQRIFTRRPLSVLVSFSNAPTEA